jgi:hypothetical protein
VHLAVLHDLDDLLLDRLADAVQLLRATGERKLRDRARGLTDPGRRTPIREDSERGFAFELEQVGKQLELIGDVAVSRQRPGHRAIIRPC